jgi:hypothetical protein
MLVVEPVGPRALPPSDPDLSARLQREYEAGVADLNAVPAWEGAFGPPSSPAPQTREGTILEVARSLVRRPIVDTPMHWADEVGATARAVVRRTQGDR